MLTCKNCKVEVESKIKKCPLCGRELDDLKSNTNNDDYINEYPTYKNSVKPSKKATALKIFLFTSIATIILSITANVFLLHINQKLWSVIVSMSAIYFYITMRTFIFSHAHLGAKILIQYFFLSALVFIIDYFSGFYKWSTNFVIPSLLVIGLLIMTIFGLKQKTIWSEYIGYLTASLLMAGLTILLFIFNLSTMLWTAVASIVYSLLTIIAMIIFAEHTFKTEIKKRFHL